MTYRPLTLATFLLAALHPSVVLAEAGVPDLGPCGSALTTFLPASGATVPADFAGVAIWTGPADPTVNLEVIDTAGVTTPAAFTIERRDVNRYVVHATAPLLPGTTLRIAVERCGAEPDPTTWPSASYLIAASAAAPGVTLAPVAWTEAAEVGPGGPDYHVTTNVSEPSLAPWADAWWVGVEVDGVPIDDTMPEPFTGTYPAPLGATLGRSLDSWLYIMCAGAPDSGFLTTGPHVLRLAAGPYGYPAMALSDPQSVDVPCPLHTMPMDGGTVAIDGSAADLGDTASARACDVAAPGSHAVHTGVALTWLAVLVAVVRRRRRI